MNVYSLARTLLFQLDPERAHGLALTMLDWIDRLKLHKLLGDKTIRLPATVMGIDFPNPVGLAAGLDKNGEHIDSLVACGFGFIEIGTVTPRPQPGNDKPRLFRLVDDEAIINRMGFNNKGVEHLLQQVRQSRCDCVLGINIGKNKDTPLEDATDDYQQALALVYQYADYVTINISSPNTPGLRALQHGDELHKLLTQLKHDQKALADKHGSYVPLVVKIAPDLTNSEIESLAKTFIQLKIDGVIATNTTSSREGLTDQKQATEQGGLSGKPLTEKADEVLASLITALGGEIPVIAAGGVMNATDACRKIELGAALVQVYTGFIYHGPALVAESIQQIAKMK